MLLSSATEYNHFPVGWTAKSLTQLSWPIKLWSNYPFEQEKSFIVLSLLPDITNNGNVVTKVDVIF